MIMKRISLSLFVSSRRLPDETSKERSRDRQDRPGIGDFFAGSGLPIFGYSLSR
jgi:hypothetical protein